MEFFEIAAEGSEADVIAVDRQGRRVFGYVAQTGLWHMRDDLVEAVCVRGDQLLEQGRLRRLRGHDEVGRMIAAGRRRRGRTEGGSAQHAEQMARAGQVLTSAEVGLEVHRMRGLRPITTPGLPELVRARRRNWTHLALYAADATHSAPFTAVKTAQTTPRFDPPLEAIREVDPLTQQTRVKIRSARPEQPQEAQEKPAATQVEQEPASAPAAPMESVGPPWGSGVAEQRPVVDGVRQG